MTCMIDGYLKISGYEKDVFAIVKAKVEYSEAGIMTHRWIIKK